MAAVVGFACRQPKPVLLMDFLDFWVEAVHDRVQVPKWTMKTIAKNPNLTMEFLKDTFFSQPRVISR